MGESTLRITFIINPKSGTPKYVKYLHFLIRRHLGQSNRNVSIIKSQHPGHIREIAARAADDGYDLVVAVGGDGTVNDAAHGIINTETALGVIPTGSGNGFARSLGIPLRLEKAINIIQDPELTPIDVGKVGENIFLVSCGIGWEAVIATLFDGSRIRGVLPYATHAITTYLQYEPQEITITSEPGGWTYKGRPLLFSVANMREYGAGATVAPDADCQDGLLDICIVPRHSLLNTLKYTPELFRQRIDTIPGYLCHLASKIIISRPIAGNIHIDGSPLPAGHEINISIMPAALKVALPKT